MPIFMEGAFRRVGGRRINTDPGKALATSLLIFYKKGQQENEVLYNFFLGSCLAFLSTAA